METIEQKKKKTTTTVGDCISVRFGLRVTVAFAGNIFVSLLLVDSLHFYEVISSHYKNVQKKSKNNFLDEKH
jgi:hypothetical protein